MDTSEPWETQDIKNVIMRLSNWVKAAGDKMDNDDFLTELRVSQISEGFDNKLRMYITLASLFGADMTDKALKERISCVERVTKSMDVDDILYGFQLYFHVNESLGKKYAMVLKVLYDEDVVEEDDMLKYYDGEHLEEPGFDKAKEFAAPFLSWLRENSDDESSDEDSD